MILNTHTFNINRCKVMYGYMSLSWSIRARGNMCIDKVTDIIGSDNARIRNWFAADIKEEFLYYKHYKGQSVGIKNAIYTNIMRK